MSFYKSSIIGGRDAAGRYDNTSRTGHVSAKTASAIAARRGWLSHIEMVHFVTDMSGHGRGGETRFSIDARTGEALRIGYVDVDDSADVFALDE